MPSEKDNILEFNQYVKYDKMSCIIYADIESLIKKWMWKQSRIFFSTKNRWAYSLRIFNIIDLHIGSHRQQTYFILQKILHQKVLWIFKWTHEKSNWFWKEKNVTINNSRTKITSRCKSMLYLWKKNIKKALKNTNHQKQDIIATTKVNTEAQVNT